MNKQKNALCFDLLIGALLSWVFYGTVFGAAFS